MNPAQKPESIARCAADSGSYLADICKLCRVDWPDNRTVNIVCNGHSVPSGYFKTPEVRALDSYPHLLRAGLAERFSHAVINVIVTAIGGETSESGARRFERDVLNHRPDVLTLDYALNDRGIGLERSHAAWVSMIESSLAKGIKVLLLTPTADDTSNLNDPSDPLTLHAEQVRQLAAEYQIGLVDSFSFFQRYVNNGGPVTELLSQSNHPNRKGHELVAAGLMKWFQC